MSTTNIQNFPGDVQIRGTTFIKANSNTNNIAIGTDAGVSIQGENAVALGKTAGNSVQGVTPSLLGLSGSVQSEHNATAMGIYAGSNSQGPTPSPWGTVRVGEPRQPTPPPWGKR